MAKAPKKSEHKLDIFDLLGKIDRKNTTWFDQLSPEDQKSVPMVVLMRWLSACQDQDGIHGLYLLMVNDLVNRDFWSLTKFPDLQARLMAVSGIGKTQRHQWIKAPVRGQHTNAVDKFLCSIFPGMNRQEIEITKSSLGAAGIKELLNATGTADKDQAPILKELKATEF